MTVVQFDKKKKKSAKSFRAALRNAPFFKGLKYKVKLFDSNTKNNLAHRDEAEHKPETRCLISRLTQ